MFNTCIEDVPSMPGQEGNIAPNHWNNCNYCETLSKIIQNHKTHWDNWEIQTKTAQNHQIETPMKY